MENQNLNNWTSEVEEEALNAGINKHGVGEAMNSIQEPCLTNRAVFDLEDNDIGAFAYEITNDALETSPLAVKEGDVGDGQSQVSGPSSSTVSIEELAKIAAQLVVEAEYLEHVAAEAVREAERIESLAEEMDAALMVLIAITRRYEEDETFVVLLPS